MIAARAHPLLVTFALALAFVLVAPTAVIAIMSFSSGLLLTFPPQGFSLHWYEAFLGEDRWTRAIVTSLVIGTATAATAGTVGTLMALGLVRGRFPMRDIVNALVLGPLLAPTVVLAIGLYFLFTLWHLTGTYTGLIAAHTVLALPYVVVVVSSGLRTFDRSLEQASYSLGANPVRTFRRVTLPLVFPSIAAGALFAFITSWDEVIVAYFLSTPQVRPLSVVMYSATQDTTDPTLAAVATFLTVIAGLLLTTSTLFRRRLGAR